MKGLLDQMEVIYKSPRCMGDIAEGLILGCAAYYRERKIVRREAIGDTGGSAERFLLKLVPSLNANSVQA